MNFQAYTIEKHPEWACVQIKTEDSSNRTPVHLCCVIDTSASMGDNSKLHNVKKSLQFLLDFLGPQDSISLVTFSESASTILNQIAVTATEKENIRARISVIHIESNTNLSSGIIQSRESLHLDTNGLKQGILLLTDGEANLGLTRASDILELVRNTIQKFPGTSISCVGYGINHNVELLQNISTEGGGSYYVVNNLEDVAVVFGDVLGGLVSCTYQQVRILLPEGTEVKSRYAKHMRDGRMEIVIGDLSAGMEAAFLVKMPSGGGLVLKGYNLQTYSPLEMTFIIQNTTDMELQTNGEAHYLRFEVLSLLEQTRNILSSYSERADHISKINACIETITQYQQRSEHSLWNILLEELNSCKRGLEQSRSNDMETPSIMTQHAGYLGRMRGIAAAIVSQSDDVANGVPGPIPICRTFSNQVQRNISQGLATFVTPLVRQQAVVNDYRQIHTLDPISYNNTPQSSSTPNLSPILPTLTSLPVLENIYLPSPLPPLVRQVACISRNVSAENE